MVSGKTHFRPFLTGPDLALLLGPPLTVVLLLALLHNVFAVFALYHAVLCLLLPWLLERRRPGHDFRTHLGYLGLVHPDWRGPVLLGGGLALVAGLGLWLAYLLLGKGILDRVTISTALAGWGVSPGSRWAVILIMLLINAPAEELYWRGYLIQRLDHWSRPNLAVVFIAACYASYHGLTVYLLLGQVSWAVLVLAGIWGVGIFWGWLRLRTGSVWPALLMHTGLTWTYLGIWWQVGPS